MSNYCDKGHWEEGMTMPCKQCEAEKEMTQDNWQGCPTMKSVVEAMERGDEIKEKHHLDCVWRDFSKERWSATTEYRCRPPKPKTKTVVMREAFYWNGRMGWYSTLCSEQERNPDFIRYTGNERTEEVPE